MPTKKPTNAQTHAQATAALNRMVERGEAVRQDNGTIKIKGAAGSLLEWARSKGATEADLQTLCPTLLAEAERGW